MSKLAQLIAGAPDHLASLIAQEEGFDKPGTVPARNHNPGDLEHAPGEIHDGASPIGSFANDETGWSMLERQLQLYADRKMTLREAIYQFAPPSENNSEAYLDFVCNGLGCAPEISVSEALKIP